MTDKQAPIQPSAPPPDERHEPLIVNSQILQAPPPTYGSSGNGDHYGGMTQLPPAYEEAVNYPSVPAPSYPAYQPNIFPKPQTGDPQAQTYQTWGPPPQPMQIQPPPVIHNTITTTTVLPSGNCGRCLTGTIQSETDVCCLLCLLLLTIFTFPVGLVFLCCIPCTVRKRCSNCHRLYE